MAALVELSRRYIGWWWLVIKCKEIFLKTLEGSVELRRALEATFSVFQQVALLWRLIGIYWTPSISKKRLSRGRPDR